MKRKPTKIERFIKALPGDLCDLGLAKAARRYRGLTLQQAWRKADSRDIGSVCEVFGVPAPVKCPVCPNTLSCWVFSTKEHPDELRRMLNGIPSAVRRAYAKA